MLNSVQNGFSSLCRCWFVRCLFAGLREQLLLFPILVVCLASCSLLLGGSCAIWQWWLALFLSTGLVYIRHEKATALASLLGVGAILFILWLAAIILTDDASGDNAVYHLPATRMLANGWNPIYTATPEAIMVKLGLDPGQMRVLHVLFTEKAVWIFNAIFFLFAKEPTAFLFPLPILLLLSVSFTIWHVFSKWHLSSTALLIWVIWIAAPCSISGPTDYCCALAGAGLIFAMLEDVNGKGRSYLELVGYSFWMMNSKAPGLFTCFVFWCVYVLWLFIVQRRKVRATLPFLSTAGGALMLLFVLASFTPYFTAWRDYGHPLYPFKTSDEKAYPVRDITYDFDYVDAKYECIGHIGNFLNAYVSPALVRKCYSTIRHDDDFAPVRRIWKMDYEQGRLKDCTSPTTACLRFRICLTIILLLLVPRFRFIGFAMLAGLFFFPCKYMGYMRYLPWYHIGEACLLAWGLEYCLSRRLTFLSISYVALLICQLAFHVVRFAVVLSVSINTKLVFLASRPATIFGSTWDAAFIEKGNYARDPAGDDRDASIQRELLLATKGDPTKTTLNNLVLFKETCANLKETEIAALPVQDVAKYSKTPFGFYLDEYDSGLANPKVSPSVSDLRSSLSSVPVFLMKAWCISLPKLVWLKIRNEWRIANASASREQS